LDAAVAPLQAYLRPTDRCRALQVYSVGFRPGTLTRIGVMT
jgi:hypothetical protein